MFISTVESVKLVTVEFDRSVSAFRHAYADQYRATDFVLRGPGKLELTFTPAKGAPAEAAVSRTVFEFRGDGIALGMFNTDESILGFARSCFNYALDQSKKPSLLQLDQIILNWAASKKGAWGGRR